MVVVSPDMGHAQSAARFARDLGVPVTAGNKERISDTQVVISGIVKEQLQGRRCALLYDDEIANGGSTIELSRILIRLGIEEIWVSCTHGVFAKGALDRLAAMPQITQIVTTDTVFIPEEKRNSKLRILSVAHVFAEAIKANYLKRSIGGLFVFGEEKV